MQKVYFPLVPDPSKPHVHNKSDLPAYQFHSLQKFSDQIEHAVFTRHGGVSQGAYASLNVRFGIGDRHEDVLENRRRIMSSLGFSHLVSANQTHSANVQIVDREFLRFHPSGQECDDIDALVTNLRGAPLMTQVADCQAILMYDPKRQVIASVHAGWKGLVKDVSGATLKAMREHYGCLPEDILVGISPSLGPESAFFSEPERELPSSFHPFIDKEKRVDLWGYSLQQLIGHGVRQENIELSRICTYKDAGKQFFSFRFDRGMTGRSANIIVLREGAV